MGNVDMTVIDEIRVIMDMVRGLGFEREADNMNLSEMIDLRNQIKASMSSIRSRVLDPQMEVEE